MAVHRPSVRWAERKETAFITVDLSDISDYKIDLEESSLSFHATADNKQYEFTLDFPDKVDKEKSKYSAARLIHILLYKQEPKRWHKITTQEGKLHWLKCDWNKWLDSDDEEEQALGGRGGAGGYGDMDFSQFGNLDGMGNFGGMDDPEMFKDDESGGSLGDSDATLEEKDEGLSKPEGDEEVHDDAFVDTKEEPLSDTHVEGQ